MSADDSLLLVIDVPTDLAQVLSATGAASKAPRTTFRSFDPASAVPVIVALTGVTAGSVTLIVQGREALTITARTLKDWLTRRPAGDDRYRITYNHSNDTIDIVLDADTDPHVIADLLESLAKLA